MLPPRSVDEPPLLDAGGAGLLGESDSTCLQLPAGLLSGKGSNPSKLGRAAMPNRAISHVSMQNLASFVILLTMSPVLLVLVVVSTTYLLSVLFAISGILE